MTKNKTNKCKENEHEFVEVKVTISKYTENCYIYCKRCGEKKYIG